MIAFRKRGENTIYSNYSNYTTAPINILISVKGGGVTRKITGYTLTVTSETDNGALLKDTAFTSPKDDISILTKGLSLSTVKVKFTN
jgi:hypothetical protein